MKKNNFLISVEGIDGAGKTQFIKSLTKELKDRGWNVVNKSEVKDNEKNPVIKELKKFLYDNYFETPKFTKLQTLYYSLLREMSLETKPVDKPTIYLYDRYIASTIAYQGFGFKDSNPVTVWQSQTLFFGDALPDMTIFIDTNLETAQQNISKRNKGKKPPVDYDNWQDNDRQLQNNLAVGYKFYRKHHKRNFVTVNLNENLNQKFEHQIIKKLPRLKNPVVRAIETATPPLKKPQTPKAPRTPKVPKEANNQPLAKPKD